VPVAPSRSRRASSRGQSLVELALIAPVFLLLLLTAIDLGRLLYSQITITNAAKEAALVASQGGTWQANAACSDSNTVMCGALSEAQGGFVIVEQTRVSLSPAVCDKNAPIRRRPPDRQRRGHVAIPVVTADHRVARRLEHRPPRDRRGRMPRGARRDVPLSSRSGRGIHSQRHDP
jgi:hypothetical protein